MLDWYDNAGGEEEDKAKQVLEFLKNIQQSEEQFKRISEDLMMNLDAIISSNIEITQLVSKSSTEMLKQIYKVSQDVKEVKEILQTYQSTIQVSDAKKPATFHGEKPIFIGRKNYTDKIKQYFKISNYPISLIGIGGIGKSALAFKAIHQCEEMFDLVIPIYFSELGVSLESFISSIARSLNINKVEFDKLEQKSVNSF